MMQVSPKDAAAPNNIDWFVERLVKIKLACRKTKKNLVFKNQFLVKLVF